MAKLNIDFDELESKRTARFSLLDEVVFTHTLYRIREGFERGTNTDGHYSDYSVFKSWVPRSTGGRNGYVIGKRVLYNGRVRYGWEDNPTVFTAKGAVTCYLVVEDMRKAPVYVLAEHMKLANELLEVTHPYVEAVQDSALT